MSCCYVFYAAALALVPRSPSGLRKDTAQGTEETLPGQEPVLLSMLPFNGYMSDDEQNVYVVRVAVTEAVLLQLITWLNAQYRLTDSKRRITLCGLMPHY